MNKDAFQEAQKEALASVYKDIATTGKPTEEQLRFIKMMEPKRSELDDIQEAGKAIMGLMGFMEGK